MTRLKLMRSILLASVPLAWVVLAGCGGAAPEAEAPSGPSGPSGQEAPASKAPPAPETASEPEASGEASPDPSAPTGGSPNTVRKDELSTLDGAEKALRRAQADIDVALSSKSNTRKEARLSEDKSACTTACQAFASVQRAAQAVCELAGESHQRCTQARRIKDASAKRVEPCGCKR